MYLKTPMPVHTRSIIAPPSTNEDFLRTLPVGRSHRKAPALRPSGSKTPASTRALRTSLAGGTPDSRRSGRGAPQSLRGNALGRGAPFSWGRDGCEKGARVASGGGGVTAGAGLTL